MPVLPINWINLLRPQVGVSAPPIISDGNTVAWFDFMQNITKDGSDFVSAWGDKSGNSNDLPQTTGTNQPLWTSNGVLFDGIDNFMRKAFTLVQPEFIYIVFKQVTWTTGDRVFDGNTDLGGIVSQLNTTPDLSAYAGTLSADNSNLVLDTFGIMRVLFNGASSKLQINETIAVTGDFGSSDMDGLILGARGDNPPTGHSNIQIKEMIIRKIADTSGDEQDIYNYLANKYSI